MFHSLWFDKGSMKYSVEPVIRHSWQTRPCSRVRESKFISAFFITPNQAWYLVYVNSARKVQAKICLPLKCVRRNKQYVSHRSISCACCLPARLDLADRHCDETKWKTEMVVGARLCQEPAASLASELGQWSTQSDALRQCRKFQTDTEGNTRRRWRLEAHVTGRHRLQTSGESQQTSAAVAPPPSSAAP